MKQIIQLSLFGSDPSQASFTSTTWGVLTFFPTKTDEYKETCRHCLLLNSGFECEVAPCSPKERADQKNGFFAIRQMPI